jgi:hypothetical protein
MRLLAIVLVLATGAWSHTGSMLMLCHGADGHSEIESISASCCQPATESPDASVPESTVAKSAGCADSCSDTPLLTSVDRPTPPRSVSRIAALALPSPRIACATGRTMPVGDADGRSRAWGLTEPPQLTVLRI